MSSGRRLGVHGAGYTTCLNPASPLPFSSKSPRSDTFQPNPGNEIMVAVPDIVPVSTSKEERIVRVEDYLNDKLQTSSDLDDLDSQLQNVLQKHALLKRQVVAIFLRNHHH